MNTDPADWAKALAGHSIFNGVGAHDDGWKSQVKATHEALVAAGIESVRRTGLAPGMLGSIVHRSAEFHGSVC